MILGIRTFAWTAWYPLTSRSIKNYNRLINSIPKPTLRSDLSDRITQTRSNMGDFDVMVAYNLELDARKGKEDSLIRNGYGNLKSLSIVRNFMRIF